MTRGAIREGYCRDHQERRSHPHRQEEGRDLCQQWEFPGGKMEPGETQEECLARELAEELGIEARVGKLFLSTKHTYSHMAIEFVTYEAEEFVSGEPRLRDHNEIRMGPSPKS